MQEDRSRKKHGSSVSKGKEPASFVKHAQPKVVVNVRSGWPPCLLLGKRRPCGPREGRVRGYPFSPREKRKDGQKGQVFEGLTSGEDNIVLRCLFIEINSILPRAPAHAPCRRCAIFRLDPLDVDHHTEHALDCDISGKGEGCQPKTQFTVSDAPGLAGRNSLAFLGNVKIASSEGCGRSGGGDPRRLPPFRGLSPSGVWGKKGGGENATGAGETPVQSAGMP